MSGAARLDKRAPSAVLATFLHVICGIPCCAGTIYLWDLTLLDLLQLGREILNDAGVIVSAWPWLPNII
jgi:hypothetical protein